MRVLRSRALALAIAIALTTLPCTMAVWPRPEAVTQGRKTICLSRHLEFNAVGYTSDILTAGFDRYIEILKSMPLGLGMEEEEPVAGRPFQQAADEADDDHAGRAAANSSASAAIAAAGGELHSSTGSGSNRRKHRCQVVKSVEVSVTSSDQSLNLETRESYSLEVSSPTAMIQANSVYGALRGMETLAQLARRRALREAPGGGPDGGNGYDSSSESSSSESSSSGAGEKEGQRQEGGQAAGRGSSKRLREAGLWAEDEVPEEAVWPASEIDGAPDLPGRKKRKQRKTVLLIEETAIYDAPRFRYRGLLLDTARHFLPISVIKAHLDAMTMVKMNCLHWHLTDDQSFPWESEELPELSTEGAFAPEAVYSAADVKEVVEYARYRGIRVIPELDTPGHTQSWGKSFPNLLTQCYGEKKGTAASSGTAGAAEPTGELGPINPARNESYGFMWKLIRDVSRQFPDPYLHLGGDEVDHECWKSNPEVQAFMSEKGFGSDFARLEGYWMSQMVGLAATAGKSPIVWQEAFDQGDALPPSTRVQVWKWWKDESRRPRPGAAAGSAGQPTAGAEGQAAAGTEGQAEADVEAVPIGSRGEEGAELAADSRRRRSLQAAAAAAAAELRGQPQQQGGGQRQQGQSCDPGRGCTDIPATGDAWKEELAAVTQAGYDAILSAPWYLNLGCYASQDWKDYYAADPHDFEATTEQKDHVLGGEACAWGEYIDAVNSINRVWPRAAAVAERLWSPAEAKDVQGAERRLADVRCRMLSRGIAAQSMGPGFCPGELWTRM